ncbi:hypothetical protein GCM10009696_10850 [Kocuria himachalensis]
MSPSEPAAASPGRAATTPEAGAERTPAPGVVACVDRDSPRSGPAAVTGECGAARRSAVPR